MTELTLHFEPDGCALVPLVALEAIGHSYRLEVEMPTGQLPRSAEAIVLQGCRTTPTLEVDGEVFSGNLAVLSWLTERFPLARLLPKSCDVMVNARLLTDLAFCASTLEPLAARVWSLALFDSHDGARRALEEARGALRPHLGQMDGRFAKNRWWYGDEWSIVDAYLHWVWLRVAAHELTACSHPHLVRHDAAMKQRPAVRRALAINRQIAECLAHPQLSAHCAAPQPAHRPTPPAHVGSRTGWVAAQHACPFHHISKDRPDGRG